MKFFFYDGVGLSTQFFLLVSPHCFCTSEVCIGLHFLRQFSFCVLLLDFFLCYLFTGGCSSLWAGSTDVVTGIFSGVVVSVVLAIVVAEVVFWILLLPVVIVLLLILLLLCSFSSS